MKLTYNVTEAIIRLFANECRNQLSLPFPAYLAAPYNQLSVNNNDSKLSGALKIYNILYFKSRETKNNTTKI